MYLLSLYCLKASGSLSAKLMGQDQRMVKVPSSCLEKAGCGPREVNGKEAGGGVGEETRSATPMRSGDPSTASDPVWASGAGQTDFQQRELQTPPVRLQGPHSHPELGRPEQQHLFSIIRLFSGSPSRQVRLVLPRPTETPQARSAQSCAS